MNKHHLTDDFVAALEPAAPGRRYEVRDVSVGNLAVRVGTRTKTFILLGLFGGTGTSTIRRELGRFGRMSTVEARETAILYNRRLKEGGDPGAEMQRAAEQAELRKRSTFASVMEDYLAYLPTRPRNLRSEQDTAFLRRNVLNPKIAPWIRKPISEVTAADVTGHVSKIRGRTASQAFHTFRQLKTFFTWAIVPHIAEKIGLERNPLESIKASALRLGIADRQRVFGFEEVQAYLHATASIPYPYGPCLRALIETGQRLGVVSGMRWSQINFARRLWYIPSSLEPSAEPGRTSKTDGALELPLSVALVEMLEALRKTLPPGHGDYVFSSTNGQKPVTNFSHLRTPKRKPREDQPKGAGRRRRSPGFQGRFDAAMMAFLKDLGITSIQPWVWHDVRRTVRTHLEPISGRQEVAEAAIGHTKTGVVRVYNLFKYRAPIRRAFNKWSDLLGKIELGTCTDADWEHDEDAEEYMAR